MEHIWNKYGTYMEHHRYGIDMMLEPTGPVPIKNNSIIYVF